MFDLLLSDLSPRRIVELLLRHKKKLVILPMFAVLLGATLIANYPRTYRSQAKLFLQIGRESMAIDPTASVGQTISMQQVGREDEVQSAMEVLHSREVVGAVVDELGPDVVCGRAGDGKAEGRSNVIADVLFAVPRGVLSWVHSLDPISTREAAMITVERAMEVSAERNSAVIVVKYDAKTPQLAQRVCDAIVNAYRREHVRIHRNPESSAFFEDQRNLLLGQLDSAEESVRKVKDELGIASIDGRRQTLESQFSAVALGAYEAEQEMATAKARVADLERQLKKVPERITSAKTSVPNDGADMLREQYYALQLKEMDLKSRYVDRHPLVQTVSHQAAEARKVIDEFNETRDETTDDVNSVYRDLFLDLKKERNLIAGFQARLRELHDQEQRIRADLISVNQSDLTLARLEQDAELARGKYLQYDKFFEEARIDRELQRERISNVSVLQPASLQERPVKPSKPMVALASMLLAIFGTAAAVLASEHLRGGLSRQANFARRAVAPPYGTAPEASRELQSARTGD